MQQYDEDEFGYEYKDNPFELVDSVNRTPKVSYTYTTLSTLENPKFDQVQTATNINTNMTLEEDSSGKTECYDFDDELMKITIAEEGSPANHNIKSFCEVSEEKTIDSTPNKINRSSEPKILPTDSQPIKLKSQFTSSSMKSHKGMTLSNEDLESILKSECKKGQMNEEPVIKIYTIERQSSPQNFRNKFYEEDSFNNKSIFKTFTKIIDTTPQNKAPQDRIDAKIMLNNAEVEKIDSKIMQSKSKIALLKSKLHEQTEVNQSLSMAMHKLALKIFQ